MGICCSVTRACDWFRCTDEFTYLPQIQSNSYVFRISTLSHARVRIPISYQIPHMSWARVHAACVRYLPVSTGVLRGRVATWPTGQSYSGPTRVLGPRMLTRGRLIAWEGSTRRRGWEQ
jgi:hypothetical protein